MLTMMRFNFERLPRRGKLKNGQLEMTTPSRFMNIVREHWKRIPTHRGDWPDWWTDGVASMPSETGYIREARRGLEALVAAKANHGAYLAPGLQAKIEDALILYAEHTFGHSDSMKTPWDRTCRHIESNKRALAAAGLSAVEEARGLAMAALGESPMRPGRPFRYRVVNPFNEPVHRMVRLYIESFEFDVRDVAPIVWHVEEKRELPVQRESAPRGWNFLVTIEIPASGIIHLDLQEGIPSLPHIGAHPADCALDNGPSVDAFPASQTQAVTGSEAALDHCRIRFVLDYGVIALDGIFDNDYLPLVDIEAARPAFTPVYERTPVQPVNDSAAQLEARMRMGRNRKGEDVHRSDGVLLAVDLVDDGPVRSSYALRFALEGTSMAEVHIHLRKDAPELELALRLHKESVWDPEAPFSSTAIYSGRGSANLAGSRRCCGAPAGGSASGYADRLVLPAIRIRSLRCNLWFGGHAAGCAFAATRAA